LKLPKAGYRALHQYLQRTYRKRVNEKKIRGFQKKDNLFAEVKSAIIPKANSRHSYPVSETLIKDFRPIDVTYIKIQSEICIQ
jgi:hypothetical protein